MGWTVIFFYIEISFKFRMAYLDYSSYELRVYIQSVCTHASGQIEVRIMLHNI